MTETTENISDENRLAHARAQRSITEYNSMNAERRLALASGLDGEGCELERAAVQAEERRDYYNAAARYRMAAHSWQRAHSIMQSIGYDQAADRLFKHAEDASHNVELCELKDLEQVCSWMGLTPVMHMGWWRASTTFNPDTGVHIPDMDVASKLCRAARGKLEAYRVLARKIENQTLV